MYTETTNLEKVYLRKINSYVFIESTTLQILCKLFEKEHRPSKINVVVLNTCLQKLG